MQLTGQNYIAGVTSAEGADRFYSVDPRSKQRADLPFYSATAAEVDRAVEAAVAAFREIRSYSSERIADLLDEIAHSN